MGVFRSSLERFYFVSNTHAGWYNAHEQSSCSDCHWASVMAREGAQFGWNLKVTGDVVSGPVLVNTAVNCFLTQFTIFPWQV